MLQFLNYNFFSDINALDNAPSNVEGINNVKLTNAIFEHFNVTQNINTEVNTNIPIAWDYDTILDANFENNLNAGNVDFLVEQISAIKIKRRVQGTFDWLTLATIPINSVNDLNFVFNDLLNKNGVQYEYAFVPIIENVEGNYIIDTVFSQFNGVFIGDAQNIYKFLYEVEYGSNSRNQQVGIFEVLGQQYPVFVANGALSYESGSVTATILNDDYEKTGVIDRIAITQQKDIIKDFLTNKKAKILKDWNSNEWLCIVNSNINVTYKSNYGMGIPSIQFDWTQIGDASNQQDLYKNGILTEVT